MGTKKGQRRKTARRAYEKVKVKAHTRKAPKKKKKTSVRRKKSSSQGKLF